MRVLRLQAVVTVSYLKSVRTNYMEWRAKNKALAKTLRKGDCVMFRSVSGRSIAFVFGFYAVDDEHEVTHTVLAHERCDLGDGEAFSEYMIANYAERVGIKLAGTRRLEDHFKWLHSEDYVSPVLAERALRKAAA